MATLFALGVLLAAHASALDVVGTWRVVYEYTVGRGGIFLIDNDSVVRPILWVRFAGDGTGELASKDRDTRRLFYEWMPEEPHGKQEHLLVSVQGSGTTEWYFTDLPDGRRMWTLTPTSMGANAGYPVQVFAVIERVPQP